MRKTEEREREKKSFLYRPPTHTYQKEGGREGGRRKIIYIYCPYMSLSKPHEINATTLGLGGKGGGGEEGEGEGEGEEQGGGDREGEVRYGSSPGPFFFFILT